MSLSRLAALLVWASWLFMLSGVVAADTIPDQFRFIDQSNLPLSTVITSAPITVSGIDARSPISVSGGKYSRNGGGFTTKNGYAYNGDSIRVQRTSSANYSTTTNVVLTIGGVSDTFSVTTVSAPVDTAPDPFTFIDQTGVALGGLVTSSAVTVSGINSPASVSVSGGAYSINGGAYTTVAGSVSNGSNVSVRHTASSAYATATNTTLTIGGVSDTFTSTTLADPGGFQLPPASGGNSSFTSTHFSGSNNCAMCHNGLSDGAGKDVSIITDWSSTMMANSARDPFWRAKVRSELNRNPGLSAVINDKCTRCHAPMANFEAKQNAESPQVFDGGFLSAGNSHHDEALEGVSCTLCHQIKNSPNLGTLAGFTGKYEIDGSHTIYGPFDNLFPNPMIMNVGYTPTFSPHVKDSKLCATCHNLKTPFVDASGNILSTTPESEFPEQMPYSEWERSAYAGNTPKNCQDCHMTKTDGAPISNRPMWLERRNGFAIHEFVGANKMMLDIFDKNRQQLGVLSSNFAETLTKTDAMLKSAATLSPVSQSLANGQLRFTLRVNSATGHKLPSAYPSRRVILHVTVRDGQNHVVFESGRINADGSVMHVDADTNGATFEPHHDMISSEEQVQVYEAIMGTAALPNGPSDVTYTLLRGAKYLKDNRILPAGFDKTAAPEDIKVVGDAASDGNFVGGSDEVTYQISGLDGASYQITAELVHQPIAYAFAQDLFTDNDGEIADFRKMYSASSLKTNLIASSTFSISR